jgi:hypothetical protein
LTPLARSVSPQIKARQMTVKIEPARQVTAAKTDELEANREPADPIKPRFFGDCAFWVAHAG